MQAKGDSATFWRRASSDALSYLGTLNFSRTFSSQRLLSASCADGSVTHGIFGWVVLRRAFLGGNL